MPLALWHHVEGEINPADPASRGLSYDELINSALWWHGPKFLSDNSDHCLSEKSSLNSMKCPELRKINLQINKLDTEEWDLFNLYSSLNDLLRLIAWWWRFIKNVRTKNSIERVALSYLSGSEIANAEIILTKHVQRFHFPDEYRRLKNSEGVSSNSKIFNLNPFFDVSTGCIRVGGRLSHSNLSESQKHPFILPENSVFSRLVVEDRHLRALHGGIQLTLSLVRESFWIIHARKVVKAVTSKCIPCVRHRATTMSQQMGNFPSPRVNQSDVFLHVGVDYAGPIKIRSSPGRGYKSLKGYIAVFVCFSTKAVHLEAVSSLETRQFLNAFKRFYSRRGLCKHIYSDCGTNFIGADEEIRKLFQVHFKENREIINDLASRGIEWHFNPPAAPHFGGLWEAAVKSVKYHLKRIIGETALTFEEISTLLACIEACLNSRPLTPIHDDSNELEVLTPAHFLIGRSLLTLPEESLLGSNTNSIKRWQLINHIRDNFWKQWCQDYLQSLQPRGKWAKISDNIKNGSIVLIKHENTPPTRWPLGKVLEIFPGEDGLVRVVSLRKATSILKRPIYKLVLLPIECE